MSNQHSKNGKYLSDGYACYIMLFACLTAAACGHSGQLMMNLFNNVLVGYSLPTSSVLITMNNTSLIECATLAIVTMIHFATIASATRLVTCNLAQPTFTSKSTVNIELNPDFKIYLNPALEVIEVSTTTSKSSSPFTTTGLSSTNSISTTTKTTAMPSLSTGAHSNLTPSNIPAGNCFQVGQPCSPNGAFQIHPTNCSMYLWCVNGAFLEMPCSAGLYWDSTALTCNFATLATVPCACNH